MRMAFCAVGRIVWGMCVVPPDRVTSLESKTVQNRDTSCGRVTDLYPHTGTSSPTPEQFGAFFSREEALKDLDFDEIG